MDLNDLIERQRRFDSERHTTYGWSSPITRDNLRPLLHNVLSLTGEAGEVANLVKKFDRGDFDFDRLLEELPLELADVVLYIFKIAYQSGIDLEKAILEKMASNEIRFPTSHSSKESPVSTPSILVDARERAKYLPKSTAEAFARYYIEVGIVPPASTISLIAGMLLTVRMAKLANYEGHPEMRDAGWLKVKDAADSVELNYDQLVALTRYYDEVVKLLDGVGSTVSPA